jgi:hypothetical protein
LDLAIRKEHQGMIKGEALRSATKEEKEGNGEDVDCLRIKQTDCY